MTTKITLTSDQAALKSQLEDLYKQVWQYIESDQKSFSAADVKKLYTDMAQAAHKLHMSLKDSGHEPKHHKYMKENRGFSPEDERFYEHVHPVQDLLKFIEDIYANDDPKDVTIGKMFTMKIYTRRWGHYDSYEITRTEDGWMIDAMTEKIECNKKAEPGLSKLLDQDFVCYPKQLNEFFSYLWNKAANNGLTEKEVQKAVVQIGDWISKCEMNTPRGVFEGL